MDSPNWRQIVGGAVGVCLLGTIGYFGQARIRTDAGSQKTSLVKSASLKSKPAEPSKPDSETNTPVAGGDFNMPPPSAQIKVDISGEVEKPGVYEMADGTRVEDAIKLAGGFKVSADRTQINLALKLKDESKILVPLKKSPNAEAKEPIRTVTVGPAASASTFPHGGGSRLGSLGSGESKPEAKLPPSSPVSINSASEEELQSIPGVGPSMAKRIVDFRITNGSFSTLEDLKKVQGMGEKTFAKLREWITL